MHNILILLAFFLLAWLLAEFRANRGIRIGLGILLIGGGAAAAHFSASVIPSYERQLHRASMKKLGELAASGEITRVQHALSAYNTTAGSNGSTHSAAMKMWKVLSSEPKPSAVE